MEQANIVQLLQLQPFGADSTAPTEVRVKGGAPYFVSTGITGEPRDAEIEVVHGVLSQAQWDIVNEGPVTYFLGWEIRARKGPDVMLISLGQGVTDVPNSPYQSLTGKSYVQVAVAKRDSSPQWSHLD